MTSENKKIVKTLYFCIIYLIRHCTFLLIIILITHQQIFGQQFLNLDFEIEDKDTRLPKNWYIVEEQGCDFNSDHRITYRKNTSLLLSPKQYSNNCKAILLNQLNRQLFKGKKQIELVAYVQFKNIANSQILAISKQLSIKGNPIENIPHSETIKSIENKWYRVTLIQDISPNTEYLAVGIQASLNDSAWIDNFEIYVDQKKIIELEPPLVAEPTKSEIDWLDNKVIPIEIVDSTNNVKDLKLFQKYVNKYKVIALGEVTHGSSEIYELKNRVVQFLISNCDFTILAVEMDMAEGRLINNYLLTSEGNIEKILSQTGYWPWKTEEFLSLLKYIATYNKTHISKVQIIGFDIPFTTTGLDEIGLFASKYDINILTFTKPLESGFEKILPNVYEAKKLTDLKIKVENLLNYFQDKKSELVKLSSVKEYNSIERIIINMKQGLLYQLNVSEQDTYRDKCMAGNINWIINKNPLSKIVLWGHNSHIQKSKKSLGELLQRTHAFYSVGFSLGNGHFNAIQESQGGQIARSQLLPPIKDSYESYFMRTKAFNWFIDLKGLSKLESQNQWLWKSHQFRFVGTLLSRYQFVETNLKKNFDGLFFIKDSSPSHLLFFN